MKISNIRRLDEATLPKWKKSRGMGMFWGSIFWILMALLFLFVAYVNLFSKYTAYFGQCLGIKHCSVPFWFSLLMTIFLFPLTLGVILIGALIHMIRGK